MNGKEVMGILLACVLNLCMVVMAICDGGESSWIYPLTVATLGAVVGSSGIPTGEYRYTMWKRARRYGMKGLSIGLFTGVISTILIVAYASLAYPEVFTGTTGMVYTLSIGFTYLVPSAIGGFIGGEIQSGIRGHIIQSA